MQKFLVLVTVLGFVSKIATEHISRGSTWPEASEAVLSDRVCHYCTSNPSRQQEDAKNLMNVFIKQLKVFFIETQFKYTQFEKHTRGMRHFLATIRAHVETLDPYDTDIMNQLLFAERMFGSMVMATENASKFNYWGTTDQYLVISMIELNAALFALCDSNGLFDNSLESSIQKLYMFGTQIHQWKREFGQLKNYSTEAFEMFEDERIKAEHMIYILKGQSMKQT
ncbi:hypothetical protein OXX79_003141 [Metschnikowia pulcherrima]